jgi:hypothetical protein
VGLHSAEWNLSQVYNIAFSFILQTSKNQVRIHQSLQSKVCKKQLGEGFSLPQTKTFTQLPCKRLLSIRRERWRDWRQRRHKCLEPPHWLDVQHLHLNHAVSSECVSTNSKHVHTNCNYTGCFRVFSTFRHIRPLNRSVLLTSAFVFKVSGHQWLVKMQFLASKRTAPAPVAGVFLASSPGSGCACNCGMDCVVIVRLSPMLQSIAARLSMGIMQRRTSGGRSGTSIYRALQNADMHLKSLTVT